MPILRFIAVLGAIFVLIPADANQRERLWHESKKAAEWALAACENNPAACEVANDTWQRIKQKSAQGIDVANAFVKEFTTEQKVDQTGSAPLPARAPGRQSTPSAMPNLSLDHGTLSPADLIPQWRGPGLPQ